MFDDSSVTDEVTAIDVLRDFSGMDSIDSSVCVTAIRCGGSRMMTNPMSFPRYWLCR